MFYGRQENGRSRPVRGRVLFGEIVAAGTVGTRRNTLGCYMVKPHGQLVQVSFTHYWTSTSCLSTS